jgi:hypothetical protein
VSFITAIQKSDPPPVLVTVGSALLYCVLRVNNAAGTFGAYMLQK